MGLCGNLAESCIKDTLKPYHMIPSGADRCISLALITNPVFAGKLASFVETLKVESIDLSSQISLPGE